MVQHPPDLTIRSEVSPLCHNFVILRPTLRQDCPRHADAPSEEALYTKLRDDGLYMSEALQTKRVRSTFRPLRPPCWRISAAIWHPADCRCAAGACFRIMADERSIDPQQRALYEAVLGELRKGIPLSDAMESCAPAFPNLLLAMIRSAEAPAASTTPAPGWPPTMSASIR